MVLSNKKLKAKLRAELTTSKVDAPSPSSNSLKLLLDSASHKSILSKREKRRNLQPLQPLLKNEQTNTENATQGSDNKENKKRKRKVENQNNDNGDADITVVSNDAVINKLKKKKLKKKVENQNDDEVANGIVSNDAVTKKSKKKKAENQNDDEVANGVVSNDVITKESKKKKLKKKKKIENQNDDEVANGIGTNESKEKKEKKKKVEKENDDVANEVSSDAVTTKLSKKKRLLKKKKKREQKKKKKAKTAAEQNGSTQEGEVLKSTVPELTNTNTNTTTTTSQEKVEVPTKVYVGGIPYYSTEDDIRSYFEGCGTITEIDCMYFPETGKFRGIAFIGFKTEAAAKRALAFDGADMGGFFLKIQPYKADKAAQPARYDPEIMEGYNRIYVGNLSWDITEEELKKFFSNCNIASIKFGMDKETGEFRGYAHVDFSDSQSLKTALKLDQSVLFGRPVRITCAVPLKKKPGPSKKPGAGEKSGAGEKPGEKPSPPVPVDSKMKGRTCYECGKKGHSFSACPNKATVTSTTI